MFYCSGRFICRVFALSLYLLMLVLCWYLQDMIYYFFLRNPLGSEGIDTSHSHSTIVRTRKLLQSVQIDVSFLCFLSGWTEATPAFRFTKQTTKVWWSKTFPRWCAKGVQDCGVESNCCEWSFLFINLFFVSNSLSLAQPVFYFCNLLLMWRVLLLHSSGMFQFKLTYHIYFVNEWFYWVPVGDVVLR